jgi:hypothetical protein
MEQKEDLQIRQAVSCLKDHLENHSDRDGDSPGYRIEQAIVLLQKAHAVCIKNYSSGTGSWLV